MRNPLVPGQTCSPFLPPSSSVVPTGANATRFCGVLAAAIFCCPIHVAAAAGPVTRPTPSLPATYPARIGDLPAPQCPPLIRGVLWDVVPDRDGPKVEAIIDAMAGVGMNLLWILGPNEFLTQAENPVLKRIFDEADHRGWRVILTTSSNGPWYIAWDIPALKKVEDRNILLMARMYGHRRSFFGWYINYEIYVQWDERGRQIRELYNHIGRLTRTATPKARLTISPFFLVDKDQVRDKFRYAPPAEYSAFWSETIRQAGINIVMLQDSSELHCACVDVPTRIAFFKAMQAACRTNHAELWGNVEAVEVASPDMADYARNIVEYRRFPWSFNMTRNVFKLDLASRYSTNLVSWGWEFWNPILPQTKVGDSTDNYAAYKAYFEKIRRRQPRE